MPPQIPELKAFIRADRSFRKAREKRRAAFMAAIRRCAELGMAYTSITKAMGSVDRYAVMQRVRDVQAEMAMAEEKEVAE